MHVRTTEETLPFEWRITMAEEHALSVEVGDHLEPASDVFGKGVEAVTKQVGMEAVMSGLLLLGLDEEHRKMLALLVASAAGLTSGPAE